MARSGGSVALTLLMVVLLAAVAGGSPSGSLSQPQRTAADSVDAVQGNGTRLPADTTTIRIAVRPDGTAVWEVSYRISLDDRETRSRFETVDARIEAKPLRYTGPYREMMSEAAEVAASRTGRSMEIRNVTVRARRLPTGDGIVVYRFLWTGFASRSGGRLVIGDAITRLPLSDADTKLVVQWPAGFEAREVSPEPDTRRDRAVIWTGPVAFAPYEPRVTVGGGLPLAPGTLAAIGIALVLLAVGGAGVGGVYWWRRQEASPDEATGPSSDAGAPGETDGTGTTGRTETADDAAAGATTGTAGAAADASADRGGSGAAGVPDELLSDPERVVDLLESRGGRMKQQEVVSELGWSETKTSQVVNEMQEEGTIEVYRIGRENVLSLPGEMDV